MTRLFLSLAVFVAILLAGAPRAAADAQADAAAKSNAEKLDRLFQLMRVEEVLRGFPEALLQGMDENPGAWGTDMPREAVKQAAERHFNATVMANGMRLLMTGTMTPADLDAAIQFYSTDLGRRIVALEVAAAAPELADTVEKEGARIYGDLQDRDSPRIGQIRRMIEAMSLIDWGMAMVMNMSFAMFSAVYAGPEAEGGLSEEQILTMINASMGGLRGELTAVMNAESAFTYRDLSDEEFERYVMFLETREGLALAKASLDAIREVMINRSRAFGDELRVLMRQRRS